MKKVLVLATAIALLAAPAFAAGIRNTKHDLSSTSGNSISSNNYNEICVFCHTPHGANTAQIAPLWNRSAIPSAFAATSLYNTSTLTAGVSNPTTVLSKVNNSDARLCLSCHDGSSLTGSLLNPANTAGGSPPTGLTNITAGSPALIGTDLTNDHPIGMVYASVQPAAEFVSSPTPAKIAFYDGGVMWCSSCHDVHDNTYQPFLNTSNAASALCRACHIK